MFKNRDITTYIPGHAQRTIENAHGMIIELRKEKTEILGQWVFSGERERHEIEIIDEKIKQWEEVIKLWSGKLEPSRNKLVWSIVVPICVSLIVSILLFHFLGKDTIK